MNKVLALTLALSCVSMVGCSSGGGSSSSGSSTGSTTSSGGGSTSSSSGGSKPAGEVYGPYNTGTSPEAISVYFDLDEGEQVDITDEAAATNDVWDIHFRRTDLLLNSKATAPVTAYFTNNNSDFFDAEGEPVAASFIDATPESELEDFTVVTASNIPAGEMFITDVDTLAIGEKFWTYDHVNHKALAADEQYFIVQSSDGNFSKIRAKSIESIGYTIGTLTLGIAVQNIAEGDTQFKAEMDLIVDAVACTSDIYIDLETYSVVASDAAWDLSLPCVTVDPDTGADFEMNLADGASSIDDTADGYDGIIVESVTHYKFQENNTQVKFFKTFPWYKYALNGAHGIWSQYGVYLIKTDKATFKFQITSYYDESGASGQFNFRFEKL